MIIFPVIMCGGTGTRLWPTSRPSRPKQFIALTSSHSPFQETVNRVAPLAIGGGELVVVAGQAHRSLILDQLAEIGRSAVIILEPEARDSAAAMAAAATWITMRATEGVAAIVASDHHIPDAQAFQTAVITAANEACSGRVVTLGVKPTEPSCAYGYIKPSGPGLSFVERFVEKPDTATAHEYAASGFLWNTGNFIVRASTLLSELEIHAPQVAIAAKNAVAETSRWTNPMLLGPSFLSAPRISIDYALMEKTAVASVLEVDFDWSDLGAWDAIAKTGHGSHGLSVMEDCTGCLVRSAPGMITAAIGLSNIAIVCEPDAVLVCDLSRAQDVKKILTKLRETADTHLDFASDPSPTLEQLATDLARWLQLNALPIWCSLGTANDGSFEDALSLDGRKIAAARRARVQARQIYVYAKAGALGWTGPWQRIVSEGTRTFLSRHQRDDGLVRTLMSNDGAILDDTATVYDQAFSMLALAAAQCSGVVDAADVVAKDILQALMRGWLPNGGLRESSSQPFQANCHMHLLEAALAWEETTTDANWSLLTDKVVDLAKGKFIDTETGQLREFFDSDWMPAQGASGRVIEPGHQFEWAWLFVRHWRRRGEVSSLEAARSLYQSGKRGVDERRGIAINEISDDGAIRCAHARLWPQTEWIKAALILSEETDGDDRAVLMQDATIALQSLMRYLKPSGLWHDKLTPEDTFVDEPAPASSFYHIISAFDQLAATTSQLSLLSIRLH